MSVHTETVTVICLVSIHYQTMLQKIAYSYELKLQDILSFLRCSLFWKKIHERTLRYCISVFGSNHMDQLY